MPNLSPSPAGLENRSKASLVELKNNQRTPQLIAANLWALENTEAPGHMGPGTLYMIIERAKSKSDDPAVVVNETIQWLGTSCGLSFIQKFIAECQNDGYQT